MPLVPGTHLGSRYEILSLLGAGGMGEVYRAKDLTLGREVAIKVLPSHLSQDPHALSRFEREAKALAALSHPNILTIHDFGVHDGISFAVMELLKGETLRSRLAPSKIPWKKAVEMAVSIADGLAAAHSAGVIHRDLKPENIFITSDESVRILDFGLARWQEKVPEAMQTSAPTMSRTNPGIVMGTLSYMSPEQVRGESVDERTDIFSFGCVLYEMLSQTPVFIRKTHADIISAILNENPPELAESGHEIPEQLQGIITRCLEKNCSNRFQSSRDLAFALKSVSSDTTLGTIRKVAVPRITYTKTALLFLVLAVIGISTYLLKYRSYPIYSVAILPFTNANTDPEAEYLSDGITESLINSMSQIPKLRVMARGTVFTYKGKNVDPKKVGQDLKVEAVVTGRVNQQGENLVVQVELVKAKDGAQIWGSQFNRKFSDLYSIQGDISKEIAEKLRLKLTGEETKRLVKHYTEDNEAYKLFLKGQYYHRKDYQKSLDYYEQAVSKDPKYALAYTSMASLYAYFAFQGLLPPKEAYQSSLISVRKALEIDNTFAEVHDALGIIYWTYEWKWGEAEKEFQRAIELSSHCCSTNYAWFLQSMRRFDEAITILQRATDLDPLSIKRNTDLGTAFYWAGKNNQAIEEFQNALELDPNAEPAVHDHLSDVYARKQMHKEAIAEQQRYLKLLGDETASDTLGSDFQTLGYSKAMNLYWKRILESLEAVPKEEYISPMNFVFTYVNLGDKDNAFLWLEKAYEERSPWIVYLGADPQFDSIRSDPRFEQLMKRIGLPL